MTIRVLAVADSDSYLKWACATLDRLGPVDDPDLDRSAVLVKTPIAPTTGQIAAAVAGSSVVRPAVLPVSELAAKVRSTTPDIVVIAATGPVAEVVARAVVAAAGERRPALVTGLPGMALPATPEGTGWRRWCDAFVVHSRREVTAYREAFATHGVAPAIPLAHLPFLERTATSLGAEPVKRVVFAAQAKVPDNRPDRVELLDRLARLAEEVEVIVKLRARKGERQTHNEAFPYDELWDAEHERLGHRSDALRFVDGPMAEWLQAGTALMTVSSTAAMESLALGLSTVILDDFGVTTELLNEPFAGSGCVMSVADAAAAFRAGGPAPDPEWLDDNYLHTTESELPATVRELAERRAAGTLTPLTEVKPWLRSRYLRMAAQMYLPKPAYDAIRLSTRPVRLLFQDRKA
ncbi:DUF6716 putative glycosyltransferase [Promicromonospora citrea]|uniref:Uncharacterized protein n=1 Tax=Promicromonospora citrea TaxID=43677 RepID=A0A8H9L3I5_9MICO|nr:DUF6716 putative glycosyltransferase [Promicromonospora citrea]NNH53729.1 hypothetical protein [Promicromonospora citrea]GGM27537.1 hypothetical protein GCM10010102_24000 [Promicromonospora citrea]